MSLGRISPLQLRPLFSTATWPFFIDDRAIETSVVPTDLAVDDFPNLADSLSPSLQFFLAELIVGQVQRLVRVLESLWVEKDLVQGQVRSFEQSDGLSCLEDVEHQVPDLLVLIPRFLQGDDSRPVQTFESLRDVRPDKVCQAWRTVLRVSAIARSS